MKVWMDEIEGTEDATGAERRLAKLGIVLPPSPAPLGSNVQAVRAGRLVFVSAQVPSRDGRLPRMGVVGTGISVDEAIEEARYAALNALAALRDAIGSLDHVRHIVKVTVYVASAPDFCSQHLVANGASDLMVALFGEAGRAARAAIGVARLPLGAPVEVEVVAELASED